MSGYHVLGVDYFFGDAVHLHTEPGFELWPWIDKCLVKAQEVTPKWIDAVVDKYGMLLLLFVRILDIFTFYLI